ncbi:DUF4232 domain-containing protein [Streptomyces palmae]|uniref:DUF4232 domain-containing protein n=1 Tax=Streptomyces palmae TaxID=1701085 RepID=A0A4Z0H8I4_9ACTN|nr:DUF4232 domain-containing protein [Streptomyces palmae]TGB07362.1 DUF4232 domain-containing protein [Streptomyces palmae]
MSSKTVRTVRRRALRVAAAALTVAAGLTLTACSDSDAGGTKSSGKADSAVAAANPNAANPGGADTSGAGSSNGSGSSTGAQGSDATAGSGGKTGSGAKTESGTQAGSKAATQGSRTASGIQRCHTDALDAAFATGDDAVPDPNAQGATTTSIVLTNSSGRTCKIGGFPGVDLKSENGGQVWSLQRSSAKYGSITLAPGDSTDFTISLALAAEGDENTWMPAQVEITPPNETTSLTLDWPWGALVDQTGATHPATFVNPIG